MKLNIMILRPDPGRPLQTLTDESGADVSTVGTKYGSADAASDQPGNYLMATTVTECRNIQRTGEDNTASSEH